MTIREIEDATGLPRANVRYYESLGLIHPRPSRQRATGITGRRIWTPC